MEERLENAVSFREPHALLSLGGTASEEEIMGAGGNSLSRAHHPTVLVTHEVLWPQLSTTITASFFFMITHCKNMIFISSHTDARKYFYFSEWHSIWLWAFPLHADAKFDIPYLFFASRGSHETEIKKILRGPWKLRDVTLTFRLSESPRIVSSSKSIMVHGKKGGSVPYPPGLGGRFFVETRRKALMPGAQLS